MSKAEGSCTTLLRSSTASEFLERPASTLCVFTLSCVDPTLKAWVLGRGQHSIWRRGARRS